MQDIGIEPLEIAALIAGVFLCLVRAFPVFKGNLNTVAFSAMIVKLVKADNIDRAKKLCGAAPNSWVIGMVRPLLDVGEIDGSLGRGLVREELEVRFFRARKKQLARAWSFWWVGVIGLGLTAAGAAMAFTRGASPPPQILIAPTIALLINVWAIRSVLKVKRDTEVEGKKIIATLTDHIVGADN